MYYVAGILGPEQGGGIPSWWYDTIAVVIGKGATKYHGFSDGGQRTTMIADIEGAYQAGLLISKGARDGIYIVNAKNNNVSGGAWGDVHVYGYANAVIGNVGTLVVDGGNGEGLIGIHMVTGSVKFVNGGNVLDTAYGVLRPLVLDTGLQTIAAGATMTVIQTSFDRDVVVESIKCIYGPNSVWLKIVDVTAGTTLYNVLGNWSERKVIPAGHTFAIQLYNSDTSSSETARYLIFIR